MQPVKGLFRTAPVTVTFPYRIATRLCIAIACTLSMVAIGCADKSSFGGNVDGTTVSVSEAFERSSLGRTVVIEGRIHDVCRDEGCWFILSDSSKEITVRYVDEMGLGIPVIAGGRSARVKGKIRDTVIGRNRVPELRASGIVLTSE